MRFFLDANVVLDVLSNREDWAVASSEVMALVLSGPHEAFIAAHSFPILHYLLRKAIGPQRAVQALIDLSRIVQTAPIHHEHVLQALALAWKDFEDALQVVAALAVDADVFVTRNPRDFLASPIQVLEPEELLARLRTGELPGPEWRPVIRPPSPEDDEPEARGGT